MCFTLAVSIPLLCNALDNYVLCIATMGCTQSSHHFPPPQCYSATALGEGAHHNSQQGGCTKKVSRMTFTTVVRKWWPGSVEVQHLATSKWRVGPSDPLLQWNIGRDDELEQSSNAE